MQLSPIFLLNLGLLTSSAFAQGSGRGNTSPDNPPDGTCNTEPDTSKKLRFRAPDFSPVESLHVERTPDTLALAEEMDRLVKRSGTYTVDESCKKAPPAGSKWGSGFPTMEAVIEQAWNDAMTLASRASAIPNNHPAFLHYFTGDPQHANVQKIMNVISSGPKVYTVNFVCAATQATAPCNSKSNAVTDASVATGPGDSKTITLCPLFFTSASTKFFLFQAKIGKNPGVPFRDNTASGWCNNKKDANFFATIGHTLLHELTHLDNVGKAAGLSADTRGRHGTFDAQNQKKECELLGARSYLARYKADTNNPSPEYNAESLAAAATEFYFSQICSFTEIAPKTLKIPTPKPSKPQCGPKYDTTVANAKAMNLQLDSQGGNQCCSSGKGGCINIATAGGQGADLCTADNNKAVLCVDCARVANYLDGLIKSCTKDGNVGGKQDIVEASGLSIQI